MTVAAAAASDERRPSVDEARASLEAAHAELRRAYDAVDACPLERWDEPYAAAGMSQLHIISHIGAATACPTTPRIVRFAGYLT